MTGIAGPALAALVPHAGAMCLLGSVLSWDAAGILCSATSHLAVDNPLRRAGRLAAVCGAEYAMQAAALHGALLDSGARQPAGRVAALRGVRLLVPYLDDPAFGALGISAQLQHREAGGLLYSFTLTAADGRRLVSGRAAVALPRMET
jgi:predicted hotdog family 3-hydroxylacyl-ACP dehydratase